MCQRSRSASRSRRFKKTQDIQGFREAIAAGIEIDSIGHLAEPVLEINRQIRERGLRPTIEAWNAGELDL